ncbi:putative pimeloyl-BioC--CoA transferase BioH [Klebsiella michiganensis]|nr:putative pimeloyl-BioC--CoA transferase BioH [Klebsiella michiganensis]
MPKCGIASRRSWLRILTLHLVDLPGYGRSGGFGAMSLEEMAQRVLENAPERAIWLGWSLGGLVASQVALSHPDRVQALVTVASSPCFSAHDSWPGIKPDVLSGFQQQLSEDFQRTVERFLAPAKPWVPKARVRMRER